MYSFSGDRSFRDVLDLGECLLFLIEPRGYVFSVDDVVLFFANNATEDIIYLPVLAISASHISTCSTS